MNQADTHPFAKKGDDVTVWPLAKIVNPEVITIGDSVIVDDFAFIMGGESCHIGSFVHIASFASISGGGELVMGDFVGLSTGGRIYTGNDDYLGGCLTGPTVPHPYRVAIRSFVHIGNHAVIGANSVVLPGVTIGEGVAIGANSFVNADCEPWMIYAGAPVRPIRSRPREKMLELERQLRSELYDSEGRYIPKQRRIAGDE